MLRVSSLLVGGLALLAGPLALVSVSATPSLSLASATDSAVAVEYSELCTASASASRRSHAHVRHHHSPLTSLRQRLQKMEERLQELLDESDSASDAADADEANYSEVKPAAAAAAAPAHKSAAAAATGASCLNPALLKDATIATRDYIVQQLEKSVHKTGKTAAFSVAAVKETTKQGLCQHFLPAAKNLLKEQDHSRLDKLCSNSQHAAPAHAAKAAHDSATCLNEDHLEHALDKAPDALVLQLKEEAAKYNAAHSQQSKPKSEEAEADEADGFTVDGVEYPFIAIPFYAAVIPVALVSRAVQVSLCSIAYPVTKHYESNDSWKQRCILGFGDMPRGETAQAKYSWEH